MSVSTVFLSVSTASVSASLQCRKEQNEIQSFDTITNQLNECIVTIPQKIAKDMDIYL